MDIDLLNDLIEEELKEANNIYPLFQTCHEAYGVMREELEETSEEFKNVKERILQDYWKLCRNDKFNINNKGTTDKLLTKLEIHILDTLKELIQLGAMVKKAKILNNNKIIEYNNKI